MLDILARHAAAAIRNTRQGGSTVSRWEPARCLEIFLPGPGEPLELGGEQAIGGKRPQPVGRDVLQDGPRVLRAAPSLLVYPMPQDIRLVAPGPAQVERKLAERTPQIIVSDGVLRQFDG